MKILIFLTFLCLNFHSSCQHGRLVEPPSRASMWRYGYKTPVDINDHQCFCGGFGVQHSKNGGQCGICGDPWHLEVKDHQAPGGVFATGLIAKSYEEGSTIPVQVELTANHQGYFEFKICPNNNVYQDPDQSCFDHYGPLYLTGENHGRYFITDYVTGPRNLSLQLPPNLTCFQCILQWTYITGNNWGDCKNGTSGLGCGPQETFRGCADVAILSDRNSIEWNENSIVKDDVTAKPSHESDLKPKKKKKKIFQKNSTQNQSQNQESNINNSNNSMSSNSDNTNSNNISIGNNKKNNSKSKISEISLPIIGFVSTKVLSERKETENQAISNKDEKSNFQRKKKVSRRLEKPEEEIKEEKNVEAKFENVEKPKFTNFVYFNWGQKLKSD